MIFCIETTLSKKVLDGNPEQIKVLNGIFENAAETDSMVALVSSNFDNTVQTWYKQDISNYNERKPTFIDFLNRKDYILDQIHDDVKEKLFFAITKYLDTKNQRLQIEDKTWLLYCDTFNIKQTYNLSESDKKKQFDMIAIIIETGTKTIIEYQISVTVFYYKKDIADDNIFFFDGTCENISIFNKNTNVFFVNKIKYMGRCKSNERLNNLNDLRDLELIDKRFSLEVSEPSSRRRTLALPVNPFRRSGKFKFNPNDI